MMLGNDSDCICHKPNGRHEGFCDAYRLSEFEKKAASIIFSGAECRNDS